jgi:hypothetical protein
MARVTGSDVDGSAAVLRAVTAAEEAGGGTKGFVTQNRHSRRIDRQGGTVSDYNGSGPSRLGTARNVASQPHPIPVIDPVNWMMRLKRAALAIAFAHLFSTLAYGQQQSSPFAPWRQDYMR